MVACKKCDEDSRARNVFCALGRYDLRRWHWMAPGGEWTGHRRLAAAEMKRK